MTSKNKTLEGFYSVKKIYNEDGGLIKTAVIPEYEMMAEHCLDKKEVCFDDTLSLKYNGKYWAWLTKIGFHNHIIKANDEHIKPQHIDMFAKAIKGRCFIDDMGFKPIDGLINVENGIIEASTGTLLPHSRDHLFKYCIPVQYDKTQSCQQWLNFLNEVFEGNKDLIEVAQRLFGYILIGGHPFLHKAFVLYGTGRNGKSTFLDILKTIIGTSSYSTVSMSKINKEFSAVNLDGKLANIVEETPTDEINAEIFKAIVGGGEIQVSHKGMDEYSLRISARMVFACNDMPIFKDKSVGLEDRLYFIPFLRYFKEEERDTNIIPKLMSELPGILNWAIEGAIKVSADHAMPNIAATTALKEVYKEETDPLYSWFKKHIIVREGSPLIITAGDLYSKYFAYCEENGNRPYSKDKFLKRIRHLVSKQCFDQKILFQPDFRFRDADGRNLRAFNVMEYVRDE